MSSNRKARLTLQQRAYVMGLRRAQARARAERERLADRFEEVVEEIHEEMAAVRARLHKVELEEAECDPHSWLH
jgi:hypothetical protein